MALDVAFLLQAINLLRNFIENKWEPYPLVYFDLFIAILLGVLVFIDGYFIQKIAGVWPTKKDRKRMEKLEKKE